eukprot:TRINITY_DN9302_c0_g1_i1.p1 TRINITY_DN9302_c0_g1~~TRINITY_DN9302_c0_g1_i1.p1  ORF type:complete len:587 (+),score=141.25 TRINITY_DN9302_c0_g1_i1:32-1792(+)
MIQLDVVEAQGLAVDPQNATPIAVLAAGQERLKTNLGSGSDPLWEYSFQINPAITPRVVVTIWNRETFLGLAGIDLEMMPLDGSRHWFTLVGRKDKNDVVSGEVCVACTATDIPAQPPARPGAALPTSIDKAPKASKEAEREVKHKVTQALSDGTNELDISGLSLVSIPEALSVYLDWVNIDLGFNRFETFPISMNKFHALEELWLTGNQISKIPPGISIPSLRVLHLNGNQLSELPDHVTQLSNLQKLDLANNKIVKITESLGNLRKLEELFLSGNPLGTVPASIGKLEYLEILDLSGCELNSLPSEFPGMGRLLELNLGNNSLTSLPSEFGKMSRIVSLNLCDNKLQELPVSMGACTHMDTCILDRNPITDQDLLKKYTIGTDHLIDYLQKKLFAQQQQAKKRQKDAAKKAAAAKLREEIAKKDAQGDKAEDDGFVEVAEEEVEEILSPEERYLKTRGNAQKSASECRNEVVTMKRALMKSSQLDEIVVIAKAIRNLIPHMNVARQQMAPIPKPQPPSFFGNEDKVTQLKKTTAVAIREFETVLNAIFNVVSGNTTMQQLAPLSEVLAGCLTILREVTKDLPPQ